MLKVSLKSLIFSKNTYNHIKINILNIERTTIEIMQTGTH
jgi:hypothetical protein